MPKAVPFDRIASPFKVLANLSYMLNFKHALLIATDPYGDMITLNKTASLKSIIVLYCNTPQNTTAVSRTHPISIGTARIKIVKNY